MMGIAVCFRMTELENKIHAELNVLVQGKTRGLGLLAECLRRMARPSARRVIAPLPIPQGPDRDAGTSSAAN